MNKEKALNVVKCVGGIVVSIGIGAVAANLIKATTPAGTKKLTKLCIGVGSFIVAGMAADAASQEFDNKFDKIVSTIKKFVQDEEKPIEKIAEGA